MIQGITIRGFQVKIGIAAEIIEKTMSGNEDMGMMRDQTARPVLSLIFCKAFLVSGFSAVETGSKLIFLDMETVMFSPTRFVMEKLHALSKLLKICKSWSIKKPSEAAIIIDLSPFSMS